MCIRDRWEWLDLLIVPLAVAAGAALISTVQKRTELDIAQQARESDQQIAGDRLRQASLEGYYDRMTELLLTHKLREAATEAEERSIARARTVAVARGLDGERKAQLLAFLRTSGLIAKDKPVIDLRGVDFSEASLRLADLRRASLIGADLRWANLNEANLSRANLSGAYLSGADLSGADLSGAILSGADLSGAKGWTIEQLELASVLAGSVMPGWTQLAAEATPYREAIEGPTFAEWRAQYLARPGTEDRPDGQT